MRQIGFSTGALAKSDFEAALRRLRSIENSDVAAIELSALRDAELPRLMSALPTLDLRRYRYVSLHAPSRLVALSEAAVAELLTPCIDRHWPVIVHPDVINDVSCWRRFGTLLCIENMDKRKKTGRTARELAPYFAALPEARLCFDVAHARQIDPTLGHAREILRRFGNRLTQIHVSELDADGKHERLSMSMVLSIQSLAQRLASEAPAIIESRVGPDDSSLTREIKAVAVAFSTPERHLAHEVTLQSANLSA